MLEALNGQTCLSVISDAGDEYTIVVHLGEKQARSLRLANPRLSFLKRTFEGSHSVLIECPWRLQDESAVLTSSFDEGERRQEALSKIEGQTIESATASGVAQDLALSFSSGLSLHAFCAEVRLSKIGDAPVRGNWSAHWPGGSVEVGPRGILTPSPQPPKDEGAELITTWTDRWAKIRAEREKADT